ncbi:MAG: glycosyltransferase family 4 protein, partial [Acidimicrobiales bacterium]
MSHTVDGRLAEDGSERDGTVQLPRRRVLILIENLPLQRDARVTRQCRVLLEAGYAVTVICPASDEAMPDDLERVRVVGYPTGEAASMPGFVAEYTWAMLAMGFLTLREFLSPNRFDLIQTCNPPDVVAFVAAPYRLLGRSFVFDHHDLVPELFEARYAGRYRALDAAVRVAEGLGLRLATRIIATNNSVREVSLVRGGRAPRDIAVVRNGPEVARVREALPKRGSVPSDGHLAVWLGVMGPYDGVEMIIESLAIVVHEAGRSDLHVTLIGDGERRSDIETLIDDLGLQDYVSLAGWVAQDDVMSLVAGADVGLAPDPPGPRLDHATVMKVMDYMAAGLPVIAFDSPETRVSVGEAGVFVHDYDATAYAKAILRLLDDPEELRDRGAVGRDRVEQQLSWEVQAQRYLETIADTLDQSAGRRDRRSMAQAANLVRGKLVRPLQDRLRSGAAQSPMPPAPPKPSGYTSSSLGAKRRLREYSNLLTVHRNPERDVEAVASTLMRATRRIEEELGRPMKGCRVVDVGAGQRRIAASVFAAENTAVALDAEVVPLRLTARSTTALA